MPRSPETGRIGRTEIVNVPGWAVTIGAIVAGALGLALFLASASLVIMLAPVVVGIALYFRWRVRRALRKMAEQQRAYEREVREDIIDGEYRVIDDADDRYRRR